VPESLYHDELSATSAPLLFTDFIGHAATHGLQFLCEAECVVPISRTLTDERELSDTIDTIAKLHFGDLLDDRGHAQPPAPRVP
jgi:hypothetical protein